MIVEQETLNEDEESRLRYAGHPFPRIMNGSGRLDELKNWVLFLNILLCLPEAFYATASKLGSIRQTLGERYYLAEGDTKINKAVFCNIHKGRHWRYSAASPHQDIYFEAFAAK
jgi:hypothetical protein